MKNLKFEYRITIAYLLIGGFWIIGSDWVLKHLFVNSQTLSQFQTYKGWFYVIVTAVMLFFFLKKHLNNLRRTERELESHKNNLQLLVDEKVENLKKLNKELKIFNDKLCSKNEIINNKNFKLNDTLTNLKETQSQLIQSEKMASLGTLISGVSHEINNPLNYIMGSYEGLNSYFEEFGSEDEKNTDLLLQSMDKGIERASDIVKGLNQFSQENDTFDEYCDIHLVLDNCLIILQNKLKNKIEILRDYSNSPIVIKGNIGKIHQAFINVLLNSIQAIDEKGIIKIKTKEIEKLFVIDIIDNGHGVDKIKLPQIVNPFFTTKSPGQGVGLGLSITYSIIKEHNGLLEFESDVDKGTKVSISLPKILKNDD